MKTPARSSLLIESLWMLLNSPKLLRKIVSKMLALVIYFKRSRMMTNAIQHSFSSYQTKEAKQIAKQSTDYQSAGIIHCLDVPKLKHQLINSTPHFDLPAHLQDRPAIFVSLHMGFADLPTYLLNQMGIPTATLIGRGENSAALNILGRRILERLSIPYIKRSNNTMLQLMEELGKGQSLMIHSDLRERGQKVSFLNRETSVPTTAAALAVFADRPLYFCYTVKESADSERCLLYISELARPTNEQLSRKDIIAALTEAIAGKMQHVISLHPEQWFWSYNRFK